jgi:hypothetical protein
MSGKLTAQDIRFLLIELEIVEKYRESPGLRQESIRHIREMLLRAALQDVDVETD